MNSGGQEEASWWLRYGARGVGCGGGIIAIGLGFFAIISFSATCILAGIWQMLAGFIVVAGEAPCCCLFIDFVDRYSKWVEQRPAWQKATLYVLISLPPIFMCYTTFSIILGSGLLFACGVMYGLMAIGKKASRNDMMANAASDVQPSFTMKSTLVNMEVPPATK